MFMGLAEQAFAGAWTLDRGRTLLISGGIYNSADRAFDGNGQASQSVTFQKVEQRIYLEHGLGSGLTAVVQGALQEVDYTASQGEERFSGFASSKIGLRAGLKPRGNWVLAVQPSLVVPAGGEGIPDGDLGRGGYGIELRALAGRAWRAGNMPGFVDAQLAYERRLKDAPQQIFADLTLGIRPRKNLQIIGQGFYHRTGNFRNRLDPVLQNQSLKLQASLIYDFGPKTSLQIGAFRNVAGRNIVREQGGLLMLWARY
jgi:hypothetical protein